jgi:hypothetical protein
VSLFNPFGSHKSSSSNTTQQTDARTVTDYSGASVGQTINIYGANPDAMKEFLQGNQQASPFANSAQATGMHQADEGIGGLSPMTLAIGAGVLLVVIALASR